MPTTLVRIVTKKLDWISLEYVTKVVTILEEVTDSEKLTTLWDWYKQENN